ncbi:MAG: hypothetical protein DELT_02544 [Desulfovibrio sp.]
MFEPDYQRAVDIRNTSKIVYAYFHADPKSLFMPAHDYAFLGPMWIVWFPETAEYTNIYPEQFDELYTLEENLPDAMRRIVSQFPTYKEWVDAMNGKIDGVVQ